MKLHWDSICCLQLKVYSWFIVEKFSSWIFNVEFLQVSLFFVVSYSKLFTYDLFFSVNKQEKNSVTSLISNKFILFNSRSVSMSINIDICLNPMLSSRREIYPPDVLFPEFPGILNWFCWLLLSQVFPTVMREDFFQEAKVNSGFSCSKLFQQLI